jgi:hypothetical protein
MSSRAAIYSWQAVNVNGIGGSVRWPLPAA